MPDLLKRFDSQQDLKRWEIYARGVLLAVLFDEDAADAAYAALANKLHNAGLCRFVLSGNDYAIPPQFESMEDMLAAAISEPAPNVTKVDTNTFRILGVTADEWNALPAGARYNLIANADDRSLRLEKNGEG